MRMKCFLTFLGGMFLNKKCDVKKLVCMALLVAIDVIFARFFILRFGVVSVRFAFVAVAFAAVKYGALDSAIVAGISDLLGALLFGTRGAYFPGFTLTAFMMGLVYGVFLHNTQSLKRIVLSAVCTQIPFSLLLNTFWISIATGKGFVLFLPGRVIQCIVMIILETFVLEYLFVKKRVQDVIE